MRIAVLALVGALAGCVDGGDDTGDTGGAPDDLADFAFGIEYVESGLEAEYAATGVTWGKTRLAPFEWGAVEPAAPSGDSHTYDWSCTDAQIVGWQQAGVAHIHAYLSPRSSWGSVAPNALVGADVMVRSEYEEDYRAWVRALIERYDGDGVDDAPGLVAPVNDWVVGPEWTGFWPSDDHEDYLRFAEWTVQEARAASVEVRLWSIPFLFMTVFTGNEPSPAEIEARLEDGIAYGNSVEGVHAILDAAPTLFDGISLHALGHYTELPPTAAWLRAEMGERDYELPIFIDDAFPMGALANRLGHPALYPVQQSQYAALQDLLESIATEDGDYATSKAWLEAEAARGLVQKVVTARGEGFAGIQVGNLEDWMVDPGSPGLRNTLIGTIGAAAAFGMMDVTHPAGYGLCDVRTPGAPRPAYHDLALLVDFLDAEVDAVERIGASEGVRGYRFAGDDGVRWALWNEDGTLELPGDPDETPTTYALDTSGLASVTVTHAVTAPGQSQPDVDTLDASGGSVTLELTGTPVLVVGTPARR